MKRLFTIVLVLIVSFAASAQKIDWHEFKRKARIAAIEARNETNAQLLNNKYYPAARKASAMTAIKYGIKAADYMKIEVDAVVTFIGGSEALIQSSRYGKNFKIKFEEGMQLEKEYKFKMWVSKELRDKKHCSGCTGILEAHVIWWNITPNQVIKDIESKRHAEENQSSGYDRSPRNGH